MSWIEKYNTSLVISMGDNTVFTPKWMRAQKTKDFNVAQFEFKGVEGSLVYRGTPKGRVYDIEIFFDGEDCLDLSDSFDKSSTNAGAWTITHPVYGSLYVQPTTLTFDNSAANCTTITGKIVETIGGAKLQPQVSIPSAITAQAALSRTTLSNSYVESVEIYKVSTIQELQGKINGYYDGIANTIASYTDYTAFTNAYAQVNALINNTVFDIKALIDQQQTVLSFPAIFNETVLSRINKMFSQFADLFTYGIGSAYALKRLYENQAGTLLSAMCEATILNYAYANRNEVLQVIDAIIAANNQFLANLDTLQTLTGGDINSYIPDPTSLFELSFLVNFTISSLFDIAQEVKQERVIYLPDTTHIVPLAYKLYGLSPNDNTIETLILSNELTLEELILIPKGRRIVYYV